MKVLVRLFVRHPVSLHENLHAQIEVIDSNGRAVVVDDIPDHGGLQPIGQECFGVEFPKLLSHPVEATPLANVS